jgi:hypothetical protein
MGIKAVTMVEATNNALESLIKFMGVPFGMSSVFHTDSIQGTFFIMQGMVYLMISLLNDFPVELEQLHEGCVAG